MRIGRGATAALCLGTWCASALGGEPFAPGSALSTQVLDSMRGGFVSDHGMKIAIGIDRAMLVNGTLIETGSIRISDLSALAAGAPGAVQTRGSPLSLIQNGPGNFADPVQLRQIGPGMMTLVQNSLDNQVIQGRTVLTIDVSGLGSVGIREAVSALNFQLHAAR
ncbi:MAG: hypothetical protein IT532_10055 [Burkholderiales bacterium]|nr:hypothetical protein [Burkholderiales bacterium]